jgi:hypothetical protein
MIKRSARGLESLKEKVASGSNGCVEYNRRQSDKSIG